MRLVQVLLNNVSHLSVAAVFNYLFAIAREIDSLSLWQSFWLNNISFLFWTCFPRFSSKLWPKIWILLRYYPCSWKELILIRKSSLHFHEVSSQIILPCNYIHPWVLIDFLESLHLWQKISCDTTIMPGNIPIFGKLLPSFSINNTSFMIFLIFFESKPQHPSCDSLDNFIFSARHIHHIFTVPFRLFAFIFWLQSFR